MRTGPRHCEVVHSQPPSHVVVLATPAPELVGEPVDEAEMSYADGSDSSEVVLVWQCVVKLVHGHRHVAGLAGTPGTGVEVTVVLRYEVNIVEH